MKTFVAELLRSHARRRLIRYPGIEIHSTARVDCNRVRRRADFILRIGEGSMIEGVLTAEREGASISIGRNSFIGNSVVSCAQCIEVGDDVMISWGCSIVDHNSHAIGWTKRQFDVSDWYQGKKNWTNVEISPVKIGDKCWLGMNAIVLKGVEIGEGTIVAAGAVVVRSVPAWTFVAGNPARVVREIPLEER